MRKHGLQCRSNPHPLFKTWCEMRYRCENPNKHNYRYYGGRGIKVCERWKEFPNFVADMGHRPPGATLDRINQDGDYEPSNCRWADAVQQRNNMSTNRVLIVDGKPMTMSEAARQWHVPVGTIWRRLQLGWDESDAAKRAVRPMRKFIVAEGKAYR